MPTIKINVPEIMETRAFTKAKGEKDRVETARVIQHKPAAWDASVQQAVWTKGVQRFANDYFASVEDPEAKAAAIANMVEGFNAGQDLVTVTGKAPRGVAKVSDPVTVRARSLARKVLKVELPTAEYKAALTDAAPVEQLATLDMWLETDPRGAKVRKLAEAQIADEKALGL